MLNFDNSLNIVSIISLAAIISPIIVAFINGIFKIIYKKMNNAHIFRMKKWEKYYSDCINAFSDLLTSSGKLLANPRSDAEIIDTLAYLYKAYSFADKQLAATLDSYYEKLESWNNNPDSNELLDDVQSYTITLSRDINRFILSNIAHSKKQKTKYI